MALLKKRGTFSLFARERGGGLVPYFNFSKISV